MTKIDHDALTEDERTTRRLIRLYRAKRGIDCTSYEVAVLNLFGAFHMHAYTKARLNEIVGVLYHFKNPDVTDALARLTRAKVLRSRREGRKTYYEVNY